MHLTSLKPIVRAVIFLSIQVYFAGCATIGGSSQYVSIDSEPRGIDVYLMGEQDPLGASPFLYKMQRVPSESFIADFGNGEKHLWRHECEYRWMLELLGNGWLVLLDPIVGTSAFLTDFLTGAAFDCGTSVFITPNVDSVAAQARKSGTSCKKVAIALSDQRDPIFNNFARSKWLEENLAALGTCNSFVDSEIAAEAFEILNLSSTGNRSVAKVKPALLYDVFGPIQVDEIVFLEADPKGEATELRPVTFDLHKYRFVENDFKSVHIDESIFRTTTVRSLFSWTFTFVPNSITYLSSTSSLRYQSENPYEVIEQQEVADYVPKYISGIGLASVSHPKSFQTWDYSIEAYPSMRFTSLNSKVVVKTASIEERVNAKTNYVAPFYNIGLTAHTVIGAFNWYGGIGFYGGMQSEDDRSQYQMGLASLSGFNHISFFNDQLYFRFGIWDLQLQFADSDNLKIQIPRRLIGFEAGVGYFLPKWRQKINSYF